MSQLPKGWAALPFRDAAAPISDQGRRLKQREYTSSGAWPVIDQGQTIPGGWTDRHDLLYDGELPVIAFGDHTRAVRLVRERFVVGAEGLKLFQSKVCEPRFLTYWLAQAPIPNRGYSRHAQFLKFLNVPVPPLAEQRRIVAEIEKQFTRLHEAENLIANARNKLKSVKRRAIQNACQSFANQRAIPFGEVIESLRNGIPEKPTGTSEHPILKISALRPFQVRLNERRYLQNATQYEEFTLREGDLLFMRYNGNPELVGISGCVPKVSEKLYYPDKLIRVRLKLGHNPRFYELIFNGGCARAHIRSLVRTTAGQSGISGADIKAACVPLVSLDEQSAAVEKIEGVLSVVDHLEAEIMPILRASFRLRQAILAKAFSGQLVPQDPNDEPASVLLECIRAGRERRVAGPVNSRRTRSRTRAVALQSE